MDVGARSRQPPQVLAASPSHRWCGSVVGGSKSPNEDPHQGRVVSRGATLSAADLQVHRLNLRVRAVEVEQIFFDFKDGTVSGRESGRCGDS